MNAPFLTSSLFRLAILISVIHIQFTSNLPGQCNASGPCQICEIEFSVSDLTGGVIEEGSSNIEGPVSAGQEVIGSDAIIINSPGCVPISFTISLDFLWDQGDAVSYFHGVSLVDLSIDWTVDGIEQDDWYFLDEVTGVCSGQSYGPGFFHDPIGTDLTDIGNFSSLMANGVCPNNSAVQSIEGVDDFLVDGDPSDNWGLICSSPGILSCPSFEFEFTYDPSVSGTTTEFVSFILTEDGLSGGWSLSQDCEFIVTIPIEVVCIEGCEINPIFADIEISNPADCDDPSIGLVAIGNGAGLTYNWSTGEIGPEISVLPTSSTIYSVTVTREDGCSDSSSINLSPNVDNSNDFENGLDIWIDGGEDAALSTNAIYADSGTNSVLLKDDSNTSFITSVPLELESVSQVNIDFSYITTGFDNENEDFWLQISLDGVNYMTVEEWNLTDEFENEVREYESIIIEGPFSDNTTIRFRCDASGNNDKVYFDDIVFEACNPNPTCVDGIQNGDETGIDCGGSSCTSCEDCTLLNLIDWEMGWEIWNDGGDDAAISDNPIFAESGSHSLMLKDNTESSLTTTNTLDLSDVESIAIDFNFITNDFDNSNEDFWLQISLDDGVSFTTVEEWNLDDEFVNNERNYESLGVSGPFSSTTKIRFRCDASGNNDKVYIDDISVSLCFLPTCEDGILNGDETGVDCGGNECSECIISEFGMTCDDALLFNSIAEMNGANFSMDSFLHPEDGPNPLCNEAGCSCVPNNPGWIAFVADCNALEMEIYFENCMQGNSTLLGIQYVLYTSCGPEYEVFDCFAHASECGEESPRLMSLNTLNVGDTYYLLIDGCSGSYCDISLNVLSTCEIDDCALEIDLESSISDFCLSETATLTASAVSGYTGPVSYEWSDGQTDSSIDVNPSTTTIYTVTATDENMCMSELSTTINHLVDVSISNIICNDNATPSDDSDDQWEFDILVEGNSSSSGWTADDPNNLTGEYGITITAGPYEISSGNLTFSVFDIDDPDCFNEVFIEAPQTCSDQCSISILISDFLCDDEGTEDTTDDTYTFSALVDGVNTGNFWITDHPNFPIGNYIYNANYSFGPFLISDGDFEFSIEDESDPTCTTTGSVILPDPCPEEEINPCLNLNIVSVPYDEITDPIPALINPASIDCEDNGFVLSFPFSIIQLDPFMIINPGGEDISWEWDGPINIILDQFEEGGIITAEQASTIPPGEYIITFCYTEPDSGIDCCSNHSFSVLDSGNCFGECTVEMVVFTEIFDDGEGAFSGLSQEGVSWETDCPSCIDGGDYFEIDNGELQGQDTNGPATFLTESIDVSTCNSISVSLEFSYDQGWEGVGNLESSDECTDCLGDPTDPLQDGACGNTTGSGCWDFLWVQMLLDGTEANAELIGESGTNDSEMSGTINIEHSTDGASEFELLITTQNWNAVERVHIDNIVVVCFQDASTINLNDWETGWGIWNDGGADAAISSNPQYANSGSHSLLLKDNTSSSIASTDLLDLGNYNEIEIGFNYITTGFDNVDHDFLLELSLDNGASFDIIEEWNYTDEFINEEREFENLSISEAFTDETILRFRCDATGNNDKVYIDDILIAGCENITGLIGDEISSRNNMELPEVTLFPNPVSRGMELNIRFSQGNNYSEVLLLNIDGQLIYKDDLESDSSQFALNTEHLEAGMYILQLKGKDEHVTKRVMIVR